MIKRGYSGCESDDVSFIARLPIGWNPPVQFYILMKDYIMKIKSKAFWLLTTSQNTTKSFYELLKDLEDKYNLEVNDTLLKLIIIIIIIKIVFFI